MTLLLNILFTDLDLFMAQFVSALSSALSGYIPPGDSFVNYLNMALPRLYSLGYWRDLVFEYTISTDANYFYIPREAESIMSAVVDGYPVDLNARWQDYKTSGRFNDSPNYLYGAVDDGLHPTKFEFDGTTKYQLKVVPVTPEVVLPTYGAVYVTYVKSDCQKVIHKFQLNGSASMQTSFSDANSVVDVELIRFEGVTSMVEVQAISGVCSSSSSSSSSSSVSSSSSSSSSVSSSSSPSSSSSSSSVSSSSGAPAYYTYNITTAQFPADACSLSFNRTVYSASSSLSNGVDLWLNTSLTTELESTYCSNSTHYWLYQPAIGIEGFALCSDL